MHIRAVIDLLVMAGRLPEVYVSVVKVKFRLYITQYCPICFDNFPECHFDKKIERVNMLLDQAFYFEKRW